jgi:hypothetical protein
VAVIERLFKGVVRSRPLPAKAQLITNTANDLLFKLVEGMSYAHEKGESTTHDAEELELQCRSCAIGC